MQKTPKILHPIFVISLLLLLLNDFYLKPTFSNFFTGKLSDFAGLIVFSVFIAVLFPFTKRWVSWVTGVLFILWKTPLVSPIIESFNKVSFFTIYRVVDYTDFFALAVLPLAHVIINSEVQVSVNNNRWIKLGKFAAASLSLFAICATSYTKPYEMPKGTIYVGKKYAIKKSKAETIEMIKSLGYNVDYFEPIKDSTSYFKPLSYYKTDNLFISADKFYPADTISSIKYTLHESKPNRTEIEIVNVTLSEEGNIQRWQTLKRLRKQYKKMVEKNLIEEIR